MEKEIFKDNDLLKKFFGLDQRLLLLHLGNIKYD